MYRCSVCNSKSSPGEMLRRHVIHREAPGPLDPETGEARTVRQIARELPVCAACHKLLEQGVPFDVLRRQSGKPIEVPAVAREVLAPPPASGSAGPALATSQPRRPASRRLG